MGNVLLIKGESQYSAMRNYIDEIEIGFRMAGYNTYVLDITEKSSSFQGSSLVNCVELDLTFMCNAVLMSTVPGYYVTYLTDHPAGHKDRLAVLDERAIVFVCDRRHEAYVRKYCPNIKYVKYIPLSGEASGSCIPYNRRSKDIVFTGSYKRPERVYKDIFYCDESVSEIAKYLAASMIENPGQDLEECLQNCLALFDMEVPPERFHELMNDFREVDQYVRYYYRDRIIRSLVENGLEVHVFGNGWEEFEGEGKENLIIEKGDFYVARKAVADAKISLNIMPWFKDGFQERIAAAMLSGTVSVTDESIYIRENFTDGKELVLYSLENLEELPVKVKWLLEHPDEAEKIAAAGKARAEKELTWQHRTFEMIRYVQECFSVEPPERGKLGEIIQIPYTMLHNRGMLQDAIKNINGIMNMIAQVKLYDKIEKCDIEYFYMQLLSLYVKISANYPEITISQQVYDYLTGTTEEQVEFAAELLNLECMHILSFLLAVENGELAREKSEGDKQWKQENMKPNGFAGEILIGKLLANYRNSAEEDIKEILENIETSRCVGAYNQNFAKKYQGNSGEKSELVQYDSEAGMFYALWNNRRMYYPWGYSKEQVLSAINFVNLEQDLQSPHRYLEGDFDVQEGDIVIDAGVAEGNFALDVIDRAKKVYLVECEHAWIEALNKTFEPWADKVVIIEKMLGDTDDETHVSIDNFVEEGHINFLKMDVEGAEVPALKGASRVLENSSKVKCAVCAYHRKNAERDICRLLEEHHFYTSTTKGYMFFQEDIDSWIDGELRHGIVRGVKL